MKKAKKINHKRHIIDMLLKISLTSFCCLFIIVNAISFVSAAGIGDAFKTADGTGKDVLDTVAGDGGYDIRAEGKETPFDFINPIFGNIISMGLSFLGIVFIILMIYGGFLWMSDTGNEDQVKKAKNLIIAAVIGLIIVVSSYAISILVVSSFSKGTVEGAQVNN